MSPSSTPSTERASDATGERLRSELGRCRSACRELERHYDELLGDPAVIQEDRDAAAAVLAGARGALATAERAMARWDAGTYGHCESCGAQIPAERLEALPEATRCVGCG